jgi:nucleotide-binding universal stress UspA family protein
MEATTIPPTYERILVPLDGSETAEQILPHVRSLARQLQATVTLLRVTTPVNAAASAQGPDAETLDPATFAEAERLEAIAYLEELAGRMRCEQFQVQAEQREGNAAEEIVRRAGEMTAGLIAMTTHGRSGLRRLVFGSVADAVLRGAPCPVLLVRSKNT